jgi:hypothetical protein
MALIDFPQLAETVRGLSFASNRLLVLAGGPGSGKSLVIQRIATELGWPIMNIGKDVSERLLSLTRRQRRLKAEEIIGHLLDTTGHREFCLDNTEILFDPALALNPVNLFLSLSRNRVVIATWNGIFENGSLVYAYSEHPERFNQLVSGFPVVSLMDDKLHLF